LPQSAALATDLREQAHVLTLIARYASAKQAAEKPFGWTRVFSFESWWIIFVTHCQPEGFSAAC
jgi:hypothetical protein